MEQAKVTKKVEPPRWPTVRCPGCLRSWLAVGLRRGDTYICKACGRRFVVEKQEVAGRPGLALG